LHIFIVVLFYCGVEMIDPYSLFGVDPNTTTMKELKKKYFELALITHPDKAGGNSDAILVVHNAYLYCKEQIENAERRTTTVEELEHAFAEFCKVQVAAPPPLSDIANDDEELRQFHAAFDASNGGYRASFQGGYGDMMVASSYTQETAVCNYPPVGDDPKNEPLPNTFKDMIVYKEPISHVAQDYYDFTRDDPLASYTTYIKKTCLTDYVESHTVENLDDVPMPATLTYEELLAQRASLITTLAQTDP
jgi:hypothetical protein